jgi:hypothetical protein
VSAPLGAVQAGYRAGQPLDIPVAHWIVALGTAELPVLFVAAGIASLMNVIGPWGPWGVWSRRLLIVLDMVPAIALLYVFTWIEVHPFTDWLDAIPDALSGWLAALVPGGSGSATGIGRAFIEAVELVVVAVLLTFLAGWVLRRLGPVVAAILSAIARRAAGHRTAETAGRSVILLGMVVVVVVAALLTLAPIAAMALDPDLGRLVAGAAVAAAIVALVARLGVWRWDQWDERERSAARRPAFVPLPRAHVVVQAVLLATALTLTVLWIVGVDAELEVGGFRPHLGSFALFTSALVVLIGIALDVLGPRPDEPHDAPVFATDAA